MSISVSEFRQKLIASESILPLVNSDGDRIDRHQLIGKRAAAFYGIPLKSRLVYLDKTPEYALFAPVINGVADTDKSIILYAGEFSLA